MIEIRWVIKHIDRNDPFDGPYKWPVKILQYRETTGTGLVADDKGYVNVAQWSEWKDVPIVEEEGD